MNKLENAIKFATDAHAGTMRKLTLTPYILHPLEVATIVSVLTTDEDVLCAAVLHDVVEDTPHTIGEVESLFGKRVAELVSYETENKRHNLPPDSTWRIRKEESLEKLRHTDDKDVKTIWLADKLSNIRSLFRAYKRDGDKIWQHFNVKDKKEHKWYYESIAEEIKDEFKNSEVFYEYEKLVGLVFGKGDKDEQ